MNMIYEKKAMGKTINESDNAIMLMFISQNCKSFFYIYIPSYSFYLNDYCVRLKGSLVFSTLKGRLRKHKYD